MIDFNIQDLRFFLTNLSIRTLINQFGYPLDQMDNKTDEIIQEYISNPKQVIFGFTLGMSIIGLIGLRFNSDVETELRHIIVDRNYRRMGLATILIEQIAKKFKLDILIAETDCEGLKFYENLGFKIESLGMKYPNVERFQCIVVFE